MEIELRNDQIPRNLFDRQFLNMFVIDQYNHVASITGHLDMCTQQSALQDVISRVIQYIRRLLEQSDVIEILDGLIFQCESLYRYHPNL